MASNRNKTKTEQPRIRQRLTAQEAADVLGVSARQVLRWAQERALACERLGKRCVRFQATDVEAFATKRRVAVLRGA